MAVPCKRCDGIGHTEVDVLPGFPPELRHRCNGSKVEPFWANYSEAWEVAYRRLATAAGVALDFQDMVVEWHMMQSRMAEKQSKAEVDYGPGDPKGEHCSACVHFLKPDRCELVSGAIEKMGWCKLYEEKE